jgi:hypothetical protein
VAPTALPPPTSRDAHPPPPRGASTAKSTPVTILPPFNLGYPLVVVRVDDERLGVIDGGVTNGVWIEHDVHPTPCPGRHALPQIALPDFPSGYGAWRNTSIGGVSATQRRVGILRSKPNATPCLIFATYAPSPHAVRDALADATDVTTVGEPQWDETYGHVVEVAVSHPDDVAFAAARIARAGATPLLEDDTRVNARRTIGIERLDRIESSVTTVDESSTRPAPEEATVDESSTRPAPEEATVDESSTRPAPEEATDDESSTRPAPEEATDDDEWEDAPPPATTDVLPAPVFGPGLADDFGLRRGGDNWKFPWLPAGWEVPITWDHMAANMAHVRELALIPQPLRQHCAQTRLRRPGADVRALAPHVPARRIVSAGLTKAQSRQLVTAFYLLVVERVADPLLRRALGLVLFRYMIERGYTARWIGKYKQDAKYVGNGALFRNFQRLRNVYAPGNLPPKIIVERCDEHGVLHGRGSKGSRSKYAPVEERWHPKRRLSRSREMEARMRETREEDA